MTARLVGNDRGGLTSQRAFLQLWFARLFGTSAMQMLMVAVGWQMYELTGSAWDLGLVGLYQFAPALALTLVAGQVADRHHRGRIVACCFALQAVAALVLMDGALADRASRGLLLGVSLVLGAARGFQMPAQQALTPLLVPPPMLARAMAFSAAGSQIAIIGGPALGGLIFVAGAGAVYGTCVALLAAGGVLLAMIRYPHAPSPREPVNLRTLLAGVSFVWTQKTILGAIALDLFAVLLGGATALLPIFAKDLLHVGPKGLGLVRASPAMGALVVSIVLSHRPLERRIGVKMMAAVATYGVCMLVCEIPSRTPKCLNSRIIEHHPRFEHRLAFRDHRQAALQIAPGIILGRLETRHRVEKVRGL